MSVAVPLEFIKEKNITQQLSKILTIEEKNNYMAKKMNNNYVKKKISVWKLEKNILYLPYTFSLNFFKKKYNNNREFPNIFLDKNNKFTGKLLERQIEPYKESLEYLKKYKTVTIALYPSFGKTFIGTMLSWELNLYTCVLVHRESIAKAWIKTFEKYFNIDKKDIWMVEDGKIRQDVREENYYPKIIISMDGRVKKIPPRLRKKIGTLIIDEAHLFCSKNKIDPLLSFTPKYVIAETATPDKENGMFDIIKTICGNHFIRKISTKPFNMLVVDTKFNYNPKNYNYNELLTLRTENKEYCSLISDICKINKSHKTIVICVRKDDCKNILEGNKNRGLECDTLYGNKKNYLTKNFLIGTGSKIGVGFDEANFCDDYDDKPSDLLICNYTFKNTSTFEQVRGRGMRSSSPILIVFNDNNNITKKHLKIMKEWAVECKGTIIDVDKDEMVNKNIDQIINDFKNEN